MLIDSLVHQGWLKTPLIIEAFRAVKRADFMPDNMRNLADLNEALPIGYGQTISQPLTVAFMLELLQPEPGHKILDVGSGSGWTTALLAYIISEQENSKSEIRNPKQIQNLPPKADQPLAEKSEIQNGKVIAIELIPELKEFGKKNVSKYNYIEKGVVEFLCADGSKGWPKEAPYDRILASASAKQLPSAWKEQLKIGGRIVAPIESSIWLFIKKEGNKFEETEYPGFAFVPLITR